MRHFQQHHHSNVVIRCLFGSDFSFFLLCPSSFQLRTMTASHVDVNIPRCLQARCGTLLGAFEQMLQRKAFCVWRVDKEPGNHITPWWLYVRLSSSAPSKSVAKFGETDHASVNPIPHLWVRAKEDYRNEALQLLRSFMQHAEAEANGSIHRSPLPPPPPRRSPPRPTALADFDGGEYGPGYLSFSKGDVILPLPIPGAVLPEGWAYGETQDNLKGWYPPGFVACL